MSADGDTVREALWPAHIHEGAFAALARLEAAADLQAETKRANEMLLEHRRAAEAQRDALAEALRTLVDAIETEVFSFATDGINADHLVTSIVSAKDIARAALAEAGLE